MKDLSKDLSVEDLVILYQKEKSPELFEKIFTHCHRALLHFLLKKGMRLEDAEDLLQDYFISGFEVGLKNYDPSKRKVVNYIKQIILLRFFSFYKKKKTEEFRLDSYSQGSEDRSSTWLEREHEYTHLLREEIKDFFHETLLCISNENHRQALILRLCLPIRLTLVEASDLLGCTESAFSTWLYRGVMELKSIVHERKKELSFDFEDILEFFHRESLVMGSGALKGLSSSRTREILRDFLFFRKDLKYISEKFQITEKELKILVRKGIFEFLSLVQESKFLLRGGSMFLNQENVLQFIEDLLSSEDPLIKKRSTKTSGDREVDDLLRTVHVLFGRESSFGSKSKNNLSPKELFLQKLKNSNESIQSIQNRYGLSLNEVHSLLSDDPFSSSLEKKLEGFLGMDSVSVKKETKDWETRFQEMNRRLLNQAKHGNSDEQTNSS